MALKTECQTPDMVYHTHISDKSVTVTVTLPPGVEIKNAALLEANIHNAMELVFAPFFIASLVEDLFGRGTSLMVDKKSFTFSCL